MNQGGRGRLAAGAAALVTAAVVAALGYLLGSRLGGVARRVAAADGSASRAQVWQRLVGDTLAFPAELAAQLTPAPGAVALRAILLLGPQECLSCLAELERWRVVASRHGDLKMTVVLVGSSAEHARAMQSDYGDTLRVMADPASRSARALGLSDIGLLRLLVVNERIAIVQSGGDSGPVGFVEALAEMMRVRQAEGEPCSRKGRSPEE